MKTFTKLIAAFALILGVQNTLCQEQENYFLSITPDKSFNVPNANLLINRRDFTSPDQSVYVPDVNLLINRKEMLKITNFIDEIKTDEDMVGPRREPQLNVDIVDVGNEKIYSAKVDASKNKVLFLYLNEITNKFDPLFRTMQ